MRLLNLGPRFNGEWLRNGREARDLTTAELVDRLNALPRLLDAAPFTPFDIENWEDGLATPVEPDVHRLAVALGFPERFFVQYGRPITDDPFDNRTNTLFLHTTIRWGPWSRYERDVRQPRELAAPNCVLCGGKALGASWHDVAPMCEGCLARIERSTR